MTIDTVLARVTTSPSAAPVEVVTPIRPSEAIRLGCLLRPVQWFGAYCDISDAQTACVVGAMSIGFGGESVVPDWDGPTESTRQTTNAMTCPACGPWTEWGMPDGVLAHLNDDHRWSRERIADWLEGLGL